VRREPSKLDAYKHHIDEEQGLHFGRLLGEVDDCVLTESAAPRI
jgi:hypothetical protein